MKATIKKDWDKLFNSNSYEDQVAIKADLLAMQFLGLVDLKMDEMDISKKELAKKEDLTPHVLLHQDFLCCRNWKAIPLFFPQLRYSFSDLITV